MKYLLISLIAITLTSCYTDYNVTVNKNGSAHVIIDEMQEYDGEPREIDLATDYYANMDSFAYSPQISNYVRGKNNGFNRIEFDIKNIDSLENYLYSKSQEHYDHINEFRYTKKKFTITKTYAKKEGDDIELSLLSAPYTLTFVFKKKIKEIKTDFNTVEKLDAKTVKISAEMGSESINVGDKKVEIFF